MGKGLALLGLILIIVGILPLLMPMIGLGTYIGYFDLGFFTLTLTPEIYFTELMLILLGLGVILLIVGAVR
jgi:hypothetical protein